jgi:hypothetical protein
MPRHLRKCRNYDITANIYRIIRADILLKVHTEPSSSDILLFGPSTLSFLRTNRCTILCTICCTRCLQFSTDFSWNVLTGCCNWYRMENRNPKPFACKLYMKSYTESYTETDTCRWTLTHWHVRTTHLIIWHVMPWDSFFTIHDRFGASFPPLLLSRVVNHSMVGSHGKTITAYYT